MSSNLPILDIRGSLMYDHWMYLTKHEYEACACKVQIVLPFLKTDTIRIWHGCRLMSVIVYFWKTLKQLYSFLHHWKMALSVAYKQICVYIQTSLYTQTSSLKYEWRNPVVNTYALWWQLMLWNILLRSPFQLFSSSLYQASVTSVLVLCTHFEVN